jgi:hypothetical protein
MSAPASPISHKRGKTVPHVWVSIHAQVSTHNLCKVSCTSDGATIAVSVGLTVPVSDGISEAPVALQDTAKHTVCQDLALTTRCHIMAWHSSHGVAVGQPGTMLNSHHVDIQDKCDTALPWFA